MIYYAKMYYNGGTLLPSDLKVGDCFYHTGHLFCITDQTRDAEGEVVGSSIEAIILNWIPFR